MKTKLSITCSLALRRIAQNEIIPASCLHSLDDGQTLRPLVNSDSPGQRPSDFSEQRSFWAIESVSNQQPAIALGSTVEMPEPNDTDIYTFGGWQGRVADILPNGNLVVEDQESDFFEIEPNRVKFIE